MTHRSFREDLQRQLRDPEFAKEFGAAQAKSSFALTLAEARRKAGFTQKELADEAGVTQAYIAKLEGGEANPTLERIGSLLAVMGLSLKTGTVDISPYPNIVEVTTRGVSAAPYENVFWGYVPTANTIEEVWTEEMTIK